MVRFGEDHLRILRLVRFAAKLGFEVDPASKQAAAASAEKLRLIAAERIRAELEKILTGPRPAEGFEMLADLGILKVVLPEVDAMRGVDARGLSLVVASGGFSLVEVHRLLVVVTSPVAEHRL